MFATKLRYYEFGHDIVVQAVSNQLLLTTQTFKGQSGLWSEVQNIEFVMILMTFHILDICLESLLALF